MAVPLSYSIRNLRTRRLTTALTAGGMALVVFVFATVLMLEAGLRATLVQTGTYDNVVVTRRAAGTEVQSSVERVQAMIVEAQPEVALAPDGAPFASRETVVLITLPKRSSGDPSNVVIRGVGRHGLQLRSQVRLVEGRLFRPGASEIIAGRAIAERFVGAGIGERLRFGMRDWAVVGIFDAEGMGFDSEVWGDADQLMQAFRRNAYSSVVLKLSDPAAFDAYKRRVEADPRLTVEAKREAQFYADQSQVLADFIRILGITLSVIFSIGAVIGAMVTMYSAVANRTREIGTLRALGFRRASILAAFLAESVALALAGGAAGLVAASLMQFVTVSTTNWQSFSELAFRFTLTPGIVMQSLLFSALMGLAGGFLPALRASRLNIVDALREA
ncbi:ABC transporter permease [Pelomicrobium sp. G1]|uniref:ABC transporter permease n=1 Tax=unclassified Pelomicrobium TaxID=2815318 RepID=UPI003F76DA4E